MRENDHGEQLSISRQSGSELSIAGIGPVGGQIQHLSLNGKVLIPHFSGANQLAKVFGYTMAPWPNRLAGGKYTFRESDIQALNLDADGNANHGLLLDQEFEIESQHEDKLALSYSFGLDSQYPFAVDLQLEFELHEDSLLVRAIATNHSGQAAPFGIGFHPFFLLGDRFEVSAPFTNRVLTDSRMLPVSDEEISGLALNQDSAEVAGLDTCFYGADAITVLRPDCSFEIRALQGFDYFMLYRPDEQIFEEGPALAIEPMSHRANVFAEDIDSTEIAAGDSRVFSYEIRIL